ncbi:hypothetical protein [Acinetobacter sp. WZC-1]|uniref:hypothetical protein n=1 Tax=Acinetobacter sp. WZC-1 TaxID=3459034 RepID=UPI00403DFAA2
MLMHLVEYQRQKFDEMAAKIVMRPEDYLNFDSVSDFYKAEWLAEFPQGTHWSVTGLDDGAAEFYVLIEYQHHYLKIHCAEQVTVSTGVSVRS